MEGEREPVEGRKRKGRRGGGACQRQGLPEAWGARAARRSGMGHLTSVCVCVAAHKGSVVSLARVGLRGNGRWAFARPARQVGCGWLCAAL